VAHYNVNDLMTKNRTLIIIIMMINTDDFNGYHYSVLLRLLRFLRLFFHAKVLPRNLDFEQN